RADGYGALGIAKDGGGKPALRWWWAVGVFGGLAMLSKYNAALVLAGAVLVAFTDPLARRALRMPGPWIAAVIAIALFTPVIAWNAAHHWQSFNYQGGRATGLRLHPFAPLTIWGGEALFVLPWLWLPMVVLLVAALRRGPAERRGWVLALLAVIPVVLFSIVGIWSSTRILYHWATPGYLLLFPMLGDWAARLRWRRLRNAVAVISAALLAAAALVITAEVSLSFVPHLDRMFAPGKSPLLQAVDWDSIRPEIPPGVQAIATLRWYDAGKIGYALEGRHLPVTVFGAEPHEFADSAPPAALLGKNVLIIAMPGNVSDILRRFAPDFDTIRPGPALTVTDHGAVLLVIPTLIGEDMKAVPKP
ncbi:MAG: hypothetical protein B7X08_06030, partial [Acidocella sp. 20-63-7]